MNKTKKRLLTRLYRPFYRSASERINFTLDKRLRRLIQLSTVTAEEALAGYNKAFKTDFIIDEASGIDKTVYAQIQNGKVEKIEEAEFKEMYEKDWNEESSLMVFNVRWKLYDKIRAYHLIEIAIAIAVGVYLWLE